MSFIRVLPFFTIAVFITLDQLSKIAILDFFLDHGMSYPISSFFNLVLAWNTGVSFSFLSSNHAYMPYWLAGFSGLVSAVLFFWLVREKSLMTRLGLAFIIAGALGNAIDRLQYGAVVDFLDFHYSYWHFPAFNIADICINFGVLLILLEVLFFYQNKTKNDT